MLNILKKIIEIPSPSGHERKLGEYIASEIIDCVDEVKFDNVGNLIAFKKGTAENPRKLMLAAHADELGFMVTNITDKGQLKTTEIGGVNYASNAYNIVKFPNGTKGLLVPNADAGSGDWRKDKMYIDIGADDKKDAEKKVNIGDIAVYPASATKLAHKKVCGHAFDDKIGCTILLKAILEKYECVNDTYFVFTAQEEVGCRGSKTAAYAISPDIGVAYDVCGVGDVPGSRPMEVKLGGGAAIKIKDSSVICDERLVKCLTALAKDNKVKYQYEILEYGGTDTSSIQMSGAGAIAGCISIPTRFIHSPNEMIDMGDCEECLALTKALLLTI